jgi:hypothetical protein
MKVQCLQVVPVMEYFSKVKKIVKGSLDLITFSENSYYELEIFLVVLRQNVAGHCQQTFENKKFVDITQQCFTILPQIDFPANDLNFH